MAVGKPLNGMSLKQGCPTLLLPIKSSQVKYIYIALFTIQIESKLLHNINQDNLTVFVYSLKKKKTIKFGRADQ